VAEGTILVADNVDPYGINGSAAEYLFANPESKGGHIVFSYFANYPESYEYMEIEGPGLSYPITYTPVLTSSILGYANGLFGLGM
jgi:hypothetical protein